MKKIFDANYLMEPVRLAVEKLLEGLGITGSMVPVLRHVLLIVAALLIAWLAGMICRRLLVPFILKVVKKTNATWDDVIFDRQVLVNACRLVPAIIVWQLLPIVFYQFPVVEETLARRTAVYITIVATKLAVDIIDRLRYLNAKPGSSISQYIKSFCGVLRIIAIFLAVIIVVAILLGKSPFRLIAGLGATSAVLMLVFKDTIEGLVAGVRLTSNEMLHVGDWITVPGTAVNGIVEDMTLTTVKVRQFDNTIMTISPLTLVNGSFQNWKGMKESGGRRLQKMVYFDVRSIVPASDELKQRLIDRGLVKADAMQGDVINMGLFRRYMEHYLAKRTDVNEHLTLMVRQLEATQCGVPVEFYCFLRTKEWVAYEHASADILEHIYACANLFDLKVYEQYPEQ